jgi:hypothetical protein
MSEGYVCNPAETMDPNMMVSHAICDVAEQMQEDGGVMDGMSAGG